MVETLAELVEEGRLERRGGFVLVLGEPEQEKQKARLDAAGPHPVYGDARQFARDLEEWPSHWLASSGIDLSDRRPLGATHTITALIEAARHGPVRGRIAGTVTRLVGFGADMLALVDDGTAAVDVWCPAGTSHWRPSHTRRFEFEVTVEDAQAAGEELFDRLGRHRSAVVATDIRPLE